MKLKGEADGKPVNIPAPVYTAMGGRRSVRHAMRRNTWLKCVGVDSVGKSADESKHDSTPIFSESGDNCPKQASKKSL